MGRISDAREKLLQVAFDLIWNSSYGSVSVDQICARAAVNKGSFYHYFPSKTDLAVAAYEEHWRQKQADMDRIFSAQIPPLERLEGWFEFICEGQRRKAEIYGRVCGCPYASLGCEVATQDEKLRSKAQELVERGGRYVESAVADAQRLGLISVGDTKRAAEAVSAIVLGMLMRAKLRNDLSILEQLEPAALGVIGLTPVGV